MFNKGKYIFYAPLFPKILDDLQLNAPLFSWQSLSNLTELRQSSGQTELGKVRKNKKNDILRLMQIINIEIIYAQKSKYKMGLSRRRIE